MSAVDPVIERSPAGPKRQQRGIRLPQLMLSLLVVGIFALLAVWWQANTTARVPVVALARDVEVGQAMTRADFVEMYVSVDDRPDIVDFPSVDNYVGSFPLVSLRRGTLISSSMFSYAKPLQSGQGLAGLRLDAGRAPFGLSPGDTVQVLIADGANTVILAPDARIDAVRGSGSDLIVRLRTSSIEAQLIQLNADTVVLVKIAPEGPLSWESTGT